MNISILTLFPDLYKTFLDTSLIKKAQDNGHISFNLKNLFDYVGSKGRVDAPGYGSGSGMLIRPDVIGNAIETNETELGKAYKIFFSPQGKKLNQDMLFEIANLFNSKEKSHIMLLPARYEGMDTRAESYYADKIISIGDYVLMSGDIPAMVFLEGFLRLLSGVVGKQSSIEAESFSDAFVDYPQYTEPLNWNGYMVPDILRSGNHQEIKKWRKKQSICKTVKNHFKWLRGHINKKEDIIEVMEYIPPHYVILMHSDVLLPDNKIGCSSVTSSDIHDIARSARTFGIKKYFIVTPLLDQQKIVRKLIDFWQTGLGVEYNPHRHEAINNVALVNTLQEAIDIINADNINTKWGDKNKKPILITTSSKKSSDNNKRITYSDQELVWEKESPVVFIFGTACGLSSNIISQSDYIIDPVDGFSLFNHLSVRSAVAIILDRWIGINSAKLL